MRAGNGTLEAALSLGWTHVAALVLEEDDHRAKAFALKDNRSAEMSGWDPEALVDYLDGIEGFDPAELGWNDDELAALVAGVAEETQASAVTLPPANAGTTGSDVPAIWHDFKLGHVRGKVCDAVYQAFRKACDDARKTDGVVMLDDVMRRIMGVP